MYDFNYHRPSSVDEAAKLLAGSEDAKLLAGGHTFIPTMKQRLAQPSDLIDLNGIAELRGVKEASDGLVIGAMTRHGEIASADAVKSASPALAALAEHVGDPQVRNRGTVGGSISNNDPAADYPAAIVGLKATLVTNKREISGDDFFTGMFDTALEDDEILTAIKFPKPGRAAYMKFPNPASRYAMVGVMVHEQNGEVRVAVTGAGPCVFRWSEAEQALSSNFSPDALDSLTADDSDLNSDIHGSAAYRAHLIKVMAKRAVAKILG
ncbi:MAG: xanthine dehydrogenase family protein subunit M [Pseudomonadota bacterium]